MKNMQMKYEKQIEDIGVEPRKKWSEIQVERNYGKEIEDLKFIVKMYSLKYGTEYMQKKIQTYSKD